MTVFTFSKLQAENLNPGKWRENSLFIAKVWTLIFMYTYFERGVEGSRGGGGGGEGGSRGREGDGGDKVVVVVMMIIVAIMIKLMIIVMIILIIHIAQFIINFLESTACTFSLTLNILVSVVNISNSKTLSCKN